jgi:hypothetical protein
MNTIDQRILIPAPPDVVWAYLSDITHNPNWQADCQNVAFLTSKREGPGTRWRYSTARNREQVAEISAWYNGLGYEYSIIDGAPFRRNTGRIRLQEIPEGTVVQWTFSYEMGGLFGAGRGASRQVETMMETSLKNLWRRITQTNSGKTIHEAKSLMRDAPDVEARSQYKPRHPSAAKEDAVPEPRNFTERRAPEKPAQPLIIEDEIGIDDLGVARFQPPVRIQEPPVAEGDTRPRPPVIGNEAEQQAAPPIEEPDFLASLNAPTAFEPDFLSSIDTPNAITDLPSPIVRQPIPEVKEEDTRPRPAIPEATADVTTKEELPKPAPASVVKEEAPPSMSATERPAPDEEAHAAFKPPTNEPAASIPVERPTLISTSAELPAIKLDVTRADDTGERSIWEIFGLPRPSETGEIKAVVTDTPATDEAAPISYPRIEIPSEAPRPYIGAIPSEGRVGLRLRARRKLVRLRRPS